MPPQFFQKRELFDPARQRLLLFAAKIVVAILVISLLVHKISFAQLMTAFSQADAGFITAAVALLSVNILFQFLKWQLIVHRDHPKVKQRHILYSLFIGMALGLVTPGRLGDFARTLFVRNVDQAVLLALLLIDKLITLVVLYFIGIIGLAQFVAMNVHPFVWMSIFIMTIVLAVIFFILLAKPQVLRRLMAHHDLLFSRHPAVDRFVSAIESVEPPFIYQLLVWTILQTVTYCSQFVLLIRAFHDTISIVNSYLVVFAVMFTKSLLPISLGDLGVRESAAIFFLAQLNVPQAAAFNSSFLLFTINILLPSVLGLGLFLFKRQNRKSNGKIGSD